MANYRRLNLYKSKYNSEDRKMIRKLRYYFTKLRKEVQKRKIQKVIHREFGKDMPVLEEKVRKEMFDSCVRYINSCKIA